MQKFVILYFLSISFVLLAQSNEVPYDHVLTDKELINLLVTDNNPQLFSIQEQYKNGEEELALEQLALYFREKFSERYLFDWKNFQNRFEEYNQIYRNREKAHESEAFKHLDLYSASTQWKMPFENLKGEEVTSYPYRHLTRQHKSGDVALLYYYTKNKIYLNYIPEQANSLNAAFDKGLVETIEDGNGAYEVYRAGNRMYNWLFVHQVLLASKEYSWQQQITMIRTFLHTGAHLNKNNSEFRWGNHQTRGMSALAMLSILFPEIQGTDKWQQLSFDRLEEHLKKEIYNDGFQFERSVHYHISDIENYFYPYQLAKINSVELSSIWDERLDGLFETLEKIAFPDKNAPVLQDDTDSPWAEMNKIDETMALGAVLFANPTYKYFASSKLSSEHYWWFRQEQLDKLKNISTQKPQLQSLHLSETGYYVMRNGWENNDLYLITSAGLTAQKPDHQHGDMLGIGAYAHGNVILPNYQVRYYLNDLEEFKNSWVKNVMLVDSIPQGREWKGNKGGSGFGKFLNLPVPKSLAWNSNSEFDFFAATHNAYDEKNIEYYRTILFVKDGFWIVNDKLKSDNSNHTSQQIWQGHYDVEAEYKHVRSVFPNGAGLDIIQLNNNIDKISKASIRSKGRVVFEDEFTGESNWATLLFPFGDFEERLDLIDQNHFKVKGWQFSSNINCPEEIETNAKHIIHNNSNYIFLNVSEIIINEKNISTGAEKTDMWLNVDGDKYIATNCGIKKISINESDLAPGESTSIKFAQ